MTSPSRLKLLCAALGALLLPPLTQAGALDADHMKQIADSAESNVIVILKDQVAGVPAAAGHHAQRRAALHQAQAPVAAELSRLKASHVHGFDTVNAISARLSNAAIAQLVGHPLVQAVVPDLPVRLAKRAALPAWRADQVASAGAATTSPAKSSDDPQLCGTLEPEALQITSTAFASTSTPQAQALKDGQGQPVTGAGVKVAFIADGLDPTIPGFIRADGSPVFVDYQDFSGDPAGTPTDAAEAFGDASSIAAQDVSNGQVLTYDISQFVVPAHALPSPCNIRVRGMAPGASLVGLKVFSESATTTSNFVQAIEYAVATDHVDVINESFGGNPYPDNDNDPISLANSAAVAAGTTVVVSTGDAGTAGTLGSPSTNADVIAVGASTTFRLYAQTGYGAEALSNGGYVSNNISSLSSGGFAQSGTRTVDVVAPGDLGWALCSPDTSLYYGCTNLLGAGTPVQDFGGTSEASPLTAGEAALVIQAYRSTHGGASPAPALVKQIIMSSATDLGANPSEQGAGLINAYRAVQLALSYQDRNGHPAGAGRALSAAPNAVEVNDLPGTSQSASVKLTNYGTSKLHLTPALQTLGAPIASANVTLQLDPTVDSTFPNVGGAARNYVEQTFVVPAGADHLDAAIAWQNPPAGATKYVYLSLLDPSGRQAAYSLPQGGGNGYGHVDVAHPTPGTWTAIVFGRPSGSSSYTGPVQFTWAAERFVSAGMVSPASLDLAPGASATLKASFRMPSQAGDSAIAIRFPGGDGQALLADIPVLARTLVPLGSRGATFGGTLTGGNGRPGAGPTQTFAFDVPPGLKSLGLAVNVADTGYLLEGVLVDPTGMQMSVAANQDPTASDYTQAATYNALQASRTNPLPGRWRFVLVQNYYSSGNQTSLPFSASISLNQSGVSAPGLPASAGTRLHAGKAVTVPVSVTNNSNVPQLYFADARLLGLVSQQLPTFTTCAGPVLQGGCSVVFVPTQTFQATFAAQASVPITMDAYNSTGTGVGGTGNPDLFSYPVQPGVVAATTVAPEVPYGVWVIVPSEVGPYPATGAPTVDFASAAQVTMLPFDSAVSADAGDIWADFVNGTNTFNPLVLQPGQSGTINVTITPAGKPGSTVRGFLFVDTYSALVGTGDEVARLPYTYTVAP